MEREQPKQEFTPEGSGTQNRQEQRDQSHERMVAGIRAYIAYERTRPREMWGWESIEERFKGRERQDPFTPEAIIRERLESEVDNSLSKREEDKIRADFFSPVLHAWNALAIERYKFEDRHAPACGLSAAYQTAAAMQESRSETIKLWHPAQMKLLDALTDAVDLPYTKGQTEIEIPEKYRYYWKEFRITEEDLKSVAKAEAERQKRREKFK